LAQALRLHWLPPVKTAVITAVLFSSAVWAEQPAGKLSATAVYARCYAHLTGRRVPFSDARFKAVRAGTLDARAACEALLDSAALDAQGLLHGGVDASASIILNHFYDVYRSWFTVQRMEEGMPMPEYTPYTADVYDTTMPGLFLAWATFGQDAKYSAVVTHPSPVAAIRVPTGAPVYTSPGAASRSLFDYEVAAGNAVTMQYQLGFMFDPVNHSLGVRAPLSFWNPMPVSTGELAGIAPGPAAPNPLPTTFLTPFSLSDDRTLSLAQLGDSVPGFVGELDTRTSLAPAGIIATREYLMLNMGHDYTTVPDGALNLYRRWGRNVLSDLLCRDLPAVRTADVAGFLVTDATAQNVPPFRKSTTCLRCHSAVDQMAYTMRNVRWVTAGEWLSGDPLHEGYNTAHVSNFMPQGDAPYSWSSQPVDNFQTQVPRGRLYYRSYDGTLVDHQVVGASALGEALAQTSDLYVCAAKRHFQMLTGIQVSLHDMGDENNEALNLAMTPKDIEYRQFVTNLGLALQQTGDVRAMIKTIMRSKYYALADFGKSEASP
jgi:hypothetical protein